MKNTLIRPDREGHVALGRQKVVSVRPSLRGNRAVSCVHLAMSSHDPVVAGALPRGDMIIG